MNLRITLAALAVTTIAFSAPAEARHHRSAQFDPTFDAAAAPAYPMGRQARAHHARSRAAARRAAAHRTVRHSQEGGEARPGPANGETTGSGVVRSRKTGATARVSPQYFGLFQAYVDDLEAAGAVVRFMGGYRPGRCWSGGMHPCGKALDVCQYARGVVDRRCNLPDEPVMAKIAERNGLFEGGLWCHGDRGHAQVGVSAAPCGGNLYAAVERFKAGNAAATTGEVILASARNRHKRRHYAHHHHYRYASR